VQIASII